VSALPSKPPSPNSTSVDQEVDWNNFRDHLSTADKEGRRRWLFPRKPEGRFYTARTFVSYGLLLIMFAGPFVRIQGNPLLMINIIDRKFVVLGQIFWPQDSAIFAVAMLVFLTGIIVFTAAFGRLWCGWTCPQTLLMEMVFRKIEYFIEGNSIQQRALDKAPWTSRKIVKRATKHLVFLALSFLIGNTLLSYIIGSDALLRIIVDNPLNHVRGLTFMILFTALFYALFARFREQACTFICPYGRFQSTLVDKNTLVVGYDYKRGEPRGRWRGGNAETNRAGTTSGDCIDCHQCVAVCPTGIDIRDGTQMECVHCTACIDACDGIMQRINRPTGLIRYTSLNGIESGEKLRLTPRLIGYSAALIALGGLLAFLLLSRSDIETSLFRAPGALYQTMPDGKISNLYLLKLVNKTAHPIPVQLTLDNIEGDLSVIGSVLTVPAQKLVETSVLIALPPDSLHSHKIPLEIGVHSGVRKLESVRTVFIGPRTPAPTP
jgi:cytochrome c oxidase accessory protein FixG